MSGTGIFTASLLILSASTAYAADPDYFPLHNGNQWLYRSSFRGQGLQQTVEVKKTVTYGDHDYAMYAGIDGNLFLRQDEEGTLYAWDTQIQSEVKLAPFAYDDGVFVTSPDPCRQTGKIVSRNAKYKGPIGEFNNALEIRYGPGSCADAGVEKEVYLPWIGLVQRTITTIAGPRTYDLIYARIGGVTVVSGPEVSFGLTLDQSAYKAGSRMTARLAIRNDQADPLRLQFSSGQVFDLAVRNEKGELVYLWSQGMGFIQIVQTVEIQGEKNWAVVVPLDGLEPGRYTVEGWLTTSGPRVWTATVPFLLL